MGRGILIINFSLGTVCRLWPRHPWVAFTIRYLRYRELIILSATYHCLGFVAFVHCCML